MVRRSRVVYKKVETMITFTFAKGQRAAPLRGLAGNAAENDLADKFVALITEETQKFSGLVAVLVQCLVTIVRDTRVWAWLILYCSEHTKTHVMYFQFIYKRAATSITNRQTTECRERTHRHTLGCGHAIWGCQCLGHGRRFGWDLPAGNPGYKRNGRLFQLQNLLQGALSALRSPPLLDQDTAGLWGTKTDAYDSI